MGRAPNEVHGRLPHLLTVFDYSYGGIHQSLDLDSSPIATKYVSVNNAPTILVREQHALIS